MTTIRPKPFLACSLMLLGAVGCGSPRSQTSEGLVVSPSVASDAAARNAKYTSVRLAPDLAALSANERKMIPLLIAAAKAMDDVYWIQTYGDKATLPSANQPDMRRFYEINYGPWDRLDDNRPLLAEVGARPPGANFYPRNITKTELEAAIAAGGVR